MPSLFPKSLESRWEYCIEYHSGLPLGSTPRGCPTLETDHLFLLSFDDERAFSSVPQSLNFIISLVCIPTLTYSTCWITKIVGRQDRQSITLSKQNNLPSFFERKKYDCWEFDKTSSLIIQNPRHARKQPSLVVYPHI